MDILQTTNYQKTEKVHFLKRQQHLCFFFLSDDLTCRVFSWARGIIRFKSNVKSLHINSPLKIGHICCLWFLHRECIASLIKGSYLSRIWKSLLHLWLPLEHPSYLQVDKAGIYKQENLRRNKMFVYDNSKMEKSRTWCKIERLISQLGENSLKKGNNRMQKSRRRLIDQDIGGSYKGLCCKDRPSSDNFHNLGDEKAETFSKMVMVKMPIVIII